MRSSTDDKIEAMLTFLLTDSFNRSLGALEDAGAVDTKKLRVLYTGVGSKYYDIVTDQIERTVKLAVPRLRQLFQEAGEHPHES